LPFSCNLLAGVRTTCAELALPPVAELAAPPDFSVDELAAEIYEEFSDLYKSIYSHVQDRFKSLPSLLRRTNS
jgi:hypothetical protein